MTTTIIGIHLLRECKPMMADIRAKHAAAHILQSVICDAVCGECREVREGARDWLHITSEPEIDEIIDPEPGSFIGVCRMLGFNWRWLRKTLRLAVVVDTIPGELVTRQIVTKRLFTKKHLALVHNSELEYNHLYEQQQQHTDPRAPNNDSDRARKVKRSKHLLYLQVVPPTRKSS